MMQSRVKRENLMLFDKIDKRDKKLFTQEERIESYNKSNKKI